MRRNVLLYGLLCGLLIAALKAVEFRWLVLQHSVEIYGGIVAVLFSALGLWLGLRLTRPAAPAPEPVIIREVVREVVEREVVVRDDSATAWTRDEHKLESLGITPRELEILALMAEGLSNREIAERASVSENTVKTHSSRVLGKLGARRRTQAVQLGKELRLIR